MVKLHGRVLELFLKDKKENKITNIVYGKKALDKYVESFKNEDEKDKKKYLKRWDSSKLSNSVYFVYQSGRGKGHRFISNASKKGGYSYLGHLEGKNNKLFRKRVPLSVRRKRSRSRGKRRVQKGGACAPCLIGPVAGALGVGTAGYLVSRRSSSSIVNGKQSLKRKEIYEMNKNGKKVRKTFIQDGLNLKLAGKKVKAKTMKKSIKRFNNAVKRCIKSGFKKC